ncbi:MAG: type II toxin-antitoxin system YafQ family toxin [Kiritimatiellae bacterium]|nr:type II toxin-antitoxin system YafQ family toxin [Kiritimatiellia bacterium]
MSEKYLIDWTSRFKRDYKRAIKRGYDASKINAVIAKLANGEELPPANHDHPLTGNWANHRECHIAPDWLLIYQIHENILVPHIISIR